MSKSSIGKNVLATPNAVPMLIYLYEKGGSAKSSHILEAISNFNSIKSVGGRLEEAGLIVIETHESDQPGRRDYNLYKLTELGWKVSEHLKKAEEALYGLTTDDFIPASGRRVQSVKKESE